MRLADIITAIRRKVGEPYTGNTKWDDDEITASINEVKRRLHWEYARANPDAFRSTVDVTLPADTYETDVPWSRVGPPAIWGPVYDVTDDDNPGSPVAVVPRHQTDIHGVGLAGRIFYVTPTTFDTARTFRLPLVEVSQDLAHDDQEPEDIPLDLQHDLLVYGTAMELQNEEPEEIPEIWMVRYEAAKSSLLVFAKAQVKDQAVRYGEQYMNRTMANYRRNNV